MKTMQVSEEVCSPLEDELLFCEECRLYFRDACPHHGAPTFVSDTPVPENVPSRAVLSLPEGLVLQERGSGATSAGGTIGVWSSLPTLPPGWIFGPYEGEILLDKQDCTLYSWAIKENGSYFYIDATDESKSNWMRYVACASNEEEHNLTVFQYRGRIYYRVCQPIAAGTELLVWIGEEYARTLGLKLGEHFKYEFGEKELLMKLFQDLQVKPPLPSTTGTSNSSTSSNHHEHYSEIVSSIIQAQKASYQSVHPSSSAGSNAGTGTTGGTTSGTGFNFLDGTQNLVSLGRAQSRYWTFFGFQGDAYGRILDKTKIICKLCGVRLSYSGNTTNLRQHLIYKHRPEYNELVGSQSALPSSSKSSETSASPSSAGGTGGGSSRSEYASSVSGSARAVQNSSNSTVPIVRATQAIADFLVKDLLPLETVDGEGFLQMMAILEPSYKVPASSFLANSVLKEAYMQYRIKSADLIKGPVSGGTPRSCAISIDLWTHGTQDASSSRRQYVTLLAHFVDDAFDYHNLVLTSRPVLGNLSADLLQDIAGEWGIETPSYAVIGEGICHCHSVGLCTGRDSCTYVDSAITALNLAGWKSIPCAGAALQRCMETVLRRQDILRTLERSRELAERLLSSSEETQQQFFRGRDPFLRTQLKMLSREGAHWYDIYGLAQCLTDHRLLLSSLRGIGGQSSPLESQDWMVLKELGDVLKPLAVATSTLSKDRFSSLSLVKPVLTSLIYKHLAPSDADSDFTREVKKSLRDDLTQIYADPEVNQTLNLACALDPRFRGLDFLSQVDRVETFHLLKREASELAKSPRRSLGSLSVQNGKKEIFNGTDAPELGGHAPSAKKAKHTSGIEFLLGDLCSVRSSSVGSACQQAEQEIGSFQTSEASSLCQEPLNWWKVHHAQYPLLARAARKLLAVPATVVPGPWLFTEAGAAIYRKRAALSAEHVDMMVFLHGNYAGGVGSSDCNSNSGSSAI